MGENKVGWIMDFNVFSKCDEKPWRKFEQRNDTFRLKGLAGLIVYKII